MLLTPVLLGVLLVAAYLFAALRTGTVRSVGMGGRVETLGSRLSPEAVLERLSRGVDGFNIDDVDVEMTAVLLSNKPTLGTWGFFYPVIVSRAPDGGSIIELGIRSKLIQWGPLVTRWHGKCRVAVENAVNGTLPSARVVG